jgi:WD40 repeat protein
LASPLKGKRAHGNISISRTGRFLAAGVNGGYVLWDLQTEKELAFVEGSLSNTVEFGHRKAPGKEGEKQEETLLVMQDKGLFRQVIYSEHESGGVRLGPAEKLPGPGVGRHYSQSQNGQVLASIQSQGVLVLHADEPHQLIKLEGHEDVRRTAVSPDGNWVATGRFSLPGGARIWQAGPTSDPAVKGLTYKPVKDLPAGGGCLPVFSPDGKRLLTSPVTTTLPVRRWEVGTWIEVPFKEPIEGQNAIFSPDGKLVVLETGTGVARLIDANTGREYARLEDPDQHRTGQFAFTPDGAKLVCATVNGYCVHIWDLQAIRQHLATLGLDWK